MKSLSINRTTILCALILVPFVFSAGHTQVKAAQSGGSHGPKGEDSAENGIVLYLPLVTNGLDTFEQNNTLQKAYGPLVSEETYSSYISSDTDIDYYYFDTTTLGWMTIEVGNINNPTTDLDMQFFDSNGNLVGGSYGLTNKETINFLPVTTGRYYVRVYYCCGTNTPTQPYTIKASLNKPVGGGDIWGTLYALGSPLANAPITLRIREEFSVRSLVFTKTDANGQYHFKGMDSLANDLTYQPYYQGILGSGYAGYAGGLTFDTYLSGSVYPAGNLDVSPLDLVSPNSTDGSSFPVTFSWSPRPGSPSESYYLEIFSKVSTDYWNSGSLGHVSGYTLAGLPPDFDAGQPYFWSVYAFNPDGTYAGSYHEYAVQFGTGGAAISSQAKVGLKWPGPDRDPNPGD